MALRHVAAPRLGAPATLRRTPTGRPSDTVDAVHRTDSGPARAVRLGMKE
jgi:hypothetical protein